MKIYYVAGNHDAHKHSTLNGAVKCAKKWFSEAIDVMKIEAKEKNMSMEEYQNEFCSLEPDGVISQIHVE